MAIAVLATATQGLATVARAADTSARIAAIERGDVIPTGPGTAPLRLGLRELMDLYRVPGLSVAVIDNFNIVWAKGYGVTQAGTSNPVTTHTLFQAGSVSKTVAAAGALSLVEQGVLGLDRDVNDNLVTWHLPASDFTSVQKVTLRRILSHTSGLTVHGFDGYPRSGPVPTLVQILNGEKPATNVPVRSVAVPGSAWRYSGGAVEVEQQLVMDVTGLAYPDAMRRLVLDKAGMNDSTFEQPLPASRAAFAASGTDEHGHALPGDWQVIPQMAAAGLWTTPTDLATFAIEIARSVHGQSNRILSTQMAQEMLRPQVPRVAELALGNDAHPDRMGLGFFLGDATRPDLFGHIGDDPGFQAMLLMFGASGKGVAILTNSPNGISLGDYLIGRIAREYAWSEYVPPARHAIATNAALLLVAQRSGLPAALQTYEKLRAKNVPGYPLDKNTLITLGYTIAGDGSLADAIRVMTIAVRDNPDYWNAYDSLGEMYARAGNKQLAVQNYRKSLQLNPTSQTGLEALKALGAST